ncbi:hypothetical protein JFT91_13695 [Pseudomonas sp. TH08]|uniref:hypothetical protein n=1 Tax=Pseudomonas sp. TH08 TaxID=2796374 RepID=UPI0019120E72|nr:hypothetical protein [Pseudomonas sp. TH08]MBK5533636.1 hypothetical protein [Pseudomonas sp. TH08]
MKQGLNEQNQNIQVVFSTELFQPELLAEDIIYISPSSDRWNDFGFRTKIDIHVHLKEHGDLVVGGYIGFLTNSSKDLNGVDRLNDLLGGANIYVLPATVGHGFFTMLPDMDSYRKLSREFGVDSAVRILKSMNDLVALGEFKTPGNWLGLALESDVFLKSFVRNTESFYAFNNAGSILRGLAFEKFRNMSSSLAIVFQLPGKINSHEMLFRFGHDEELPKRIAVIIGENGVGKSQTLGRIVNAAITGDKALTDADSHQRPIFNRILAFAPTNEAGSVFPSDRRKRSKVWYKRFALNRGGIPKNKRACFRFNCSSFPIRGVSRRVIEMGFVCGVSRGH